MKAPSSATAPHAKALGQKPEPALAPVRTRAWRQAQELAVPTWDLIQEGEVVPIWDLIRKCVAVPIWDLVRE